MSQRIGNRGELYVLSLLQKAIPGLRQTCNSGAAQGNKDLGDSNWLVEVKSTHAKSYPLRKKLVEIVTERARELSKNPIIAVLTESATPNEESAFVAFPMGFALELLATYEREFYAPKEKECSTSSEPRPERDCCAYYGTQFCRCNPYR